jgi:hypothetical protein
LPYSHGDAAGTSTRCGSGSSMGRARLPAGAACSSGSPTPRAGGSGPHSAVTMRGTWREVSHTCV